MVTLKVFIFGVCQSPANAELLVPELFVVIQNRSLLQGLGM